MIKKKETYVSPMTEALVVRFEGIICGSPDFGDPGEAGGDAGLNDDNYNYGSF